MKRRITISVALVALLAPIVAAVIMAAPALGDEYQCTVRVFQGNRGTLSSDPVVATVPKGGSVNLYDIATATITDTKYVQTGFRLSGSDKTIGGSGRISGISEDMDFVVAYGVAAHTVSYTIRFVEYQTGRELAESKTYYGSAGERPVAAYEHIEGYRPLCLSITGTLDAGRENVWTFEYVPFSEGETIAETDTITNGSDTETAATSEDAGAMTEGGTRGTADGEAAAPQTQEILDLDTPLAGPNSSNAAGKVGTNASAPTSPAIIASIVAAAIAAGGLIVFQIRSKKNKVDEEEA